MSTTTDIHYPSLLPCCIQTVKSSTKQTVDGGGLRCDCGKLLRYYIVTGWREAPATTQAEAEALRDDNQQPPATGGDDLSERFPAFYKECTCASFKADCPIHDRPVYRPNTQPPAPVGMEDDEHDEGEPTRAQLIEAARDLYAVGSNDDIEVDDDAKLSRTDGGSWVQAWVWVNYEELSK